MGIDKKRRANIELLRILAMIGVVFLHYYNAEMGGGIKYVVHGSVNEVILQVFEAINICAVNLFMIISGYFLSKSNKRSFGRGLVLLIQVILFNIFFLLAGLAFGKIDTSLGNIFYAVVPANYFITLYIAIYIVSPLFNKMFCSLSDKMEDGMSVNKTTVIFGLIVLFCIEPTIVDILHQITGHDFFG